MTLHLVQEINVLLYTALQSISCLGSITSNGESFLDLKVYEKCRPCDVAQAPLAGILLLLSISISVYCETVQAW